MYRGFVRSAAVALAGVVSLGGCALPMPVTVASQALDGLSLAATDKTRTDLGISAVMERDCALWRGIT